MVLERPSKFSVKGVIVLRPLMTLISGLVVSFHSKKAPVDSHPIVLLNVNAPQSFELFVATQKRSVCYFFYIWFNCSLVFLI